MAKPFKGVVNVDVTASVPDWGPYVQPIAAEGTPSVLYIALDDVGFSAMEPFGGLIETPNINRIAERGLKYTNFHTTALCSPTRSCFLTGRNHTTNGTGTITEAASGFPSSNGHIAFECGTIAEVLGQRGWNTYMTGKWHLTPEDEMHLASIKSQWPIGRGFERFYGFLGAETNQRYPDLVYDNHPVEQPSLPEDGYHLTTDLTDHALSFIRDAKAIAPDKPFFLYYCPGACHAPHHAPKEWADKHKGEFNMGYEEYRELVFERQKWAGIIPEHAELSPINPYIDETSVEGRAWPEADTVRPWDGLSDDEKRLFCRMAEVYAGFLSHADHEIGRLLDYLEHSGQLDNTMIVLVSDNGASGEGGPNGSVNGRCRDPHDRAAATLQATQPLRLLPGWLRDSRIGRAQHPQPLLHDRGRGQHRHRGGRGRPVRPRLAVRWSCPLHQGPQTQIRLQLCRPRRADRGIDRTGPDRSRRALGIV